MSWRRGTTAMLGHESDLVSVVIPTRDRCAMLKRAIDSVRSQTWRNIEIIVIDDRSSDGTGSMLARMAADGPSLRVVRNDVSQGGAGARNQGIRAARGCWVAFLDDDDTWLPTKLEKQVALMKAHRGASAASCAYFFRRPIGPRRVIQVPAPLTEQLILKGNCLGGASLCLSSRETLTQLGGFDASLRSGQDWDLWIRLLDVGPIVACREPLACYESHRGARISRDWSAAYSGRRRLYFRYRNRMDAGTRRMNMALLLYFRASRRDTSLRSRVHFLRLVSSLVGARERIRYLARFILAKAGAGGH